MSVTSLDQARTLAKRNDPDTSHTAAKMLNNADRSAIKKAILEILAHKGASSVVSIGKFYFDMREANGWPDCHPHSIARRLSELHRQEHKVIDTGYRVQGEYGRPIAIWALAGDTCEPTKAA